MRLENFIDEASYIGNIGFEEMVQFHKIATDTDLKVMQKIVEREDWRAFKLLIQRVIKVRLRESLETADMKLQRDVAEQWPKWRDRIKADCKPYLNAVKDNPIWRGMYTSGELILKKSVRMNRRPADTLQSDHDEIDDSFERVYGWKPRSQAIFVTGELDIASSYGEPHMIFPRGKFRFIYSNDIRDLYAVVSGHSKFRIPTGQEKELDDFIKKHYINGKSPNEFKKAISSKNEIMVGCKDYYAVSFNVSRNVRWSLGDDGDYDGAFKYGRDTYYTHPDQYKDFMKGEF